MLSQAIMERFRANLLRWYASHRRELPWRTSKDGYAIWVSEIMLQQTRVAAAIPYFQRFLTRFPDFRALATASDDDLLAAWAGLGYYYRVRNMRRAAQAMLEEGQFPQEHAKIRDLPGVGDYTAAAVASIAFGQPYAAVDGNVVRVLSRVLNDSVDPGTGVGRRRFAEAATALLDQEQPGDFNQAMMELGATICLPRNPQCLICPVAEACRGRVAGTVNNLPFKKAKAKLKESVRTVFWIERDDEVLAWQRPPEARLMPGFWELPESAQLPEAIAGTKLGSFRHGITVHQYLIDVCEAPPPSNLNDCRWLPRRDLADLPLSTIFRKSLRQIENPKVRLRVLTVAVGH